MRPEPARPAPVHAPPSRSAIASAMRGAVRIDRTAISPAGGLIAAIPLTAVFGGAILAGDPVAAATMGAGALLVGIAWRTGGGSPPVALLVVDALLMALSTFLGSATGANSWLHFTVVFFWALAAGLLVALGRRGAVVGTQAVIGIVVFGRFAEPVAGALGLAGLVLAGGLAMTLFAALVRWPSPLRLQRRALAVAYRALAETTRAPAGSSSLPAASRLDEAKSALSSPALLGDPSVLKLRGLADEAARLRLEVRAIHVLLEQGALARAKPAQREVRTLLDRTADALLLMAGTIEGDQHLQARLQAAVAAAAGNEPADGGGLLAGRLAALQGQLRSMARQAPAAGRRAGLLDRRPQPPGRGPLNGLRADLAQVRANASLQSPAGRHAIRLAVVVVGTEILATNVPLERSYWMVVAAATALRPEFAATFTRGAERILGTCAGVALAGLIVVGLHPSAGAAVPIIGLLAWLAYSVFPASFALGFAFTTTLVVFLLDAVTTDALATASDRLLDTMVGGTIGLLAYLAWPTWSRKPARQALAEVVTAQRAYLDAVLASIIDGQATNRNEMTALARRARLAFSSAQEIAARSMQEPARRRIDAEHTQGILAAMRRLVGAVHVLRTSAPDGDADQPAPALVPLASELDRTLEILGHRLAVEPPTAPEQLPDLRAIHTRLAAAMALPDLLAQELDEIVDAVNTLAALLAAGTEAPAAAR